jgi:hypothetical protein
MNIWSDCRVVGSILHMLMGGVNWPSLSGFCLLFELLEQYQCSIYISCGDCFVCLSSNLLLQNKPLLLFNRRQVC